MSVSISSFRERVRARPPAYRCAIPLRRPIAVAVVLLSLLGMLAEGVWSQEGILSPLGARLFHIPSQPLARALQAYSQATGVEVLYESSVADGLQSTEVEGAFTPALALKILVAGTDLTINYTRSDAITLSLPMETYDLPPDHPLGNADLALDTLQVTGGSRPDAGRLSAFSASVQADIEGALRKDRRTRMGNYRASVKLWIDPPRTVRRAELAQSTGDFERDTSISEVLKGLELRTGPPANTPLPVRVVILVRSM